MLESLSCYRHVVLPRSTSRSKVVSSLYSTSFAETEVQRPEFRDFPESVKKKGGTNYK